MWDNLPEPVQEFLGWYLAPWRRIGRKEFGIALTVATLPGLFIMLFGWGSSAGSFLAPLMSLGGMGNDAGSIADVQLGLENMQQGLVGSVLPVAKVATGIDWTGIVNGICLLALVPLGRMRLRDMGWFGWQEVTLSVLFNISVVEGLVQSLTGYDILPYGMLWSFMNFAGYAWLSLAKGKARAAVFERANYEQPLERPKGLDDE